jgi:hypothetical protein
MSLFGLVAALWRSSAMKWVLLGALVLVLSLEAWDLRLWPGVFDPEVVGTWGELAAAALTLVAIVTALHESAVDRRRNRIESLCSVSAWMEARQTGSGKRRWHLLIENGTQFPIFQWWVRPADEIGAAWHLCSALHGPLVPGRSTFLIDGYHGESHASAIGVEISFVDREGTTRARRANGVLVEDGPKEDLASHLKVCRVGER